MYRWVVPMLGGFIWLTPTKFPQGQTSLWGRRVSHFLTPPLSCGLSVDCDSLPSPSGQTFGGEDRKPPCGDW